MLSRRKKSHSWHKRWFIQFNIKRDDHDDFGATSSHTAAAARSHLLLFVAPKSEDDSLLSRTQHTTAAVDKQSSKAQHTRRRHGTVPYRDHHCRHSDGSTSKMRCQLMFARSQILAQALGRSVIIYLPSLGRYNWCSQVATLMTACNGKRSTSVRLHHHHLELRL